MGGDRIRRVIILELQEEDGEVFEDFLSFLQDHPEIENCKQNKDSIISLPGLEIYPRQRRVFRNQQEIPLTKTEYEILIYLFQNSNHVLTHSQIYERIWREPDYGEARKLVSHHVQAIRRKLNLKQDSGVYLRASVMWGTASRERNEGQQPEPGCCFLLSFSPEEAESVGALPVLPHLEV